MKQFKYEFEVDTEGKVVRFAGRHFDKPRTVSTRELMKMFGYYGISKYNCQKFNEEFGITPVNLRKKLNAAIREMWIDPIEQEVKRYGFSYGSKLSPRRIQQIWDNLSVIREVQEDGLDNLEPFAAILGKNPQQMKELVGKSTWKQLCKNSRTRNTYIASVMLNRGLDSVNFGSVKTINSFPSWALKQGYKGYIPFNDSGLWVLEQFKPGEARNKHWSIVNRMLIERSDTNRMANELGLKFSEKWDYPTIHKKHEEYTKLIEERRFSKDVFDWAKDFKVKGLTHGDFEATLLDNAYAIAEEGRMMHHCVASYADASRSGDYLVYSILRKGERYSTLGIRAGLERINLVGATLVVGGKYRLNQHYKACNKPVDNEEANELAEILITKLNTITREETAEEVK